MNATMLNDEGVRNLVEAIIVQAAHDYMRDLRIFWSRLESGLKVDENKQTIKEYDRFFDRMNANGIKEECYKAARKEQIDNTRVFSIYR